MGLLNGLENQLERQIPARLPTALQQAPDDYRPVGATIYTPHQGNYNVPVAIAATATLIRPSARS